MKTVTLEIDDHMRIGQAIIVALIQSGDLKQEIWTAYGDEQDVDSVEYIVDGVDLFYMSDDMLQEKLRS